MFRVCVYGSEGACLIGCVDNLDDPLARGALQRGSRDALVTAEHDSGRVYVARGSAYVLEPDWPAIDGASRVT